MSFPENLQFIRAQAGAVWSFIYGGILCGVAAVVLGPGEE